MRRKRNTLLVSACHRPGICTSTSLLCAWIRELQLGRGSIRCRRRKSAEAEPVSEPEREKRKHVSDTFTGAALCIGHRPRDWWTRMGGECVAVFDTHYVARTTCTLGARTRAERFASREIRGADFPGSHGVPAEV